MLSFLKRLLGSMHRFTPEEIGPWLVDEQCRLWAIAQGTLNGPLPKGIDLPPIQISGEALSHLSVEPYIFQLALVCINFQDFLDDTCLESRFSYRNVRGENLGKYDLLKFAARIHAAASKIAQPYLTMKDGQHQPESLPMLPLAVDFDAIESDFLRYYAISVTGIEEESLLFPKSAALNRHERTLDACPSPLRWWAGLCYSEAFRRFLPSGQFQLELGLADENRWKAEYGVLLRTKAPWLGHFTHFQLRLTKRFEGKQLELG